MNLKKQIPNMLTILRIVLVPVYVLCLYAIDGYLGALLALIVFAIAGITDYLDGMLARKFKSVSDFGKIADPLADKIIVSVALITLALKPIAYIHFTVVIIIIFREVAVTILRNRYKKKGICVAANIWGKLKTTMQMTGIIAALAYYSLNSYFLTLSSMEKHLLTGLESQVVLYLQIFFWLVVVVTVISGLSYLPSMRKNESQ